MLPMVYMALIDDEEDKKAFEKLYNEYKDSAFQKAYSILEDVDQAEDCVAEVFLSIAQNFKKVNNLKSYEQHKYIVISSRNCAINMFKKASREKLSIDYDDIYGFNEPQYSEFSAIEWNDSIKKLNQTDLDILYLVCIQGIGYQQIAASYGISYAAAKQRFWTAKNNLKKILFEEGDAK